MLSAVLLSLTVLVLSQLRPVLTSMASARVSNSVNRIVTAAVNEAIRNGDINYDAFVSFEKDASGRVTALRSNVAEVNRMQSVIAEEILERLSEMSVSELRIPVGTLTGSALLAGRGPYITVRMQSVGSASAVFRNEFSAAGINQTRHQILLEVDVYMSILLPGIRTSTTVSNEIAVAETVIVGSVPESYTYFSATPEDIVDYGANVLD
jgi:sporulation protein YunB